MDTTSQLLGIAICWLLTLVLMHKWRARSQKFKAQSKRGKPLPELSGGLPIIGHIHQLDNKIPIARLFGSLADKYGPIFKIRLGVHPNVVISSWELVKDCFTTNDKVLANRPAPTAAGEHLSYNYAGFGFASYGPYWRQIRKLAVVEVLSSRRLDLLRHIRVSEIHNGIKSLYSSIADKTTPEKVVVISEWLEKLTLSIIVRMIAGKTFLDGGEDEDAKRFARAIKEFMFVTGQFVLSDWIPFPLFRWIDPQGHVKTMKRIAVELDAVFESWIEEHMQKKKKKKINQSEPEDFVDVMLSVMDDEDFSDYGYTRETVIKATIMNLIIAGSDTTAVTLTWLIALLLNHRHVLNHAKDEIETKVGNKRWVEESDIKDLVYLQAIVKETLRLYPPGPVAVPHVASEDCEVGGYLVPRGTRLMLNVWKLHRDPRIWSDPDQFRPERFLNTEVDASGNCFEYTPFGSGRRSCPGMTFAMQVTQLTLARLLQGFDLASPSDAAVDMTEGLGVTLPMATPLQVVVTPRLLSQLYQN